MPRICLEYYLTELAGEGGPHLAPQNILLSQKFRHLMRYKKYLEIFWGAKSGPLTHASAVNSVSILHSKMILVENMS